MKDIRYINFAPLKRYSPRVLASLIKRYHALYTQKYDWFVRPYFDVPFYCNGERPDILSAEVFDCNWTPNVWDTVPYRYFRSPGSRSLYKSYAKQGLPTLAEYDYGYTRRDSLITIDDVPHFVYFSEDNKYVWWHPNETKYALKVTYDGWQTYAYVNDDGYTFEEGTFSHMKAVKNPNIDTVMKVAKLMNAKKYRGAYQPLIDKLIEVYGLNRTQI